MRSVLGSTRRPDITFHQSGKIDITARVSNAIGLQDGDVIDLAEDRGEYYLYVRAKACDAVGKHEGRCRSTKHCKGGSRNFRAYSKRLCNFVFSLSGGQGKVRVPAGKGEHIPSLGEAINIIIRCNIIN